MSVGRPRWTSPSTCSIACWTWDARPTSASPEPDGVGVTVPAPLIPAPRPRCSNSATVAALAHVSDISLISRLKLVLALGFLTDQLCPPRSLDCRCLLLTGMLCGCRICSLTFEFGRPRCRLVGREAAHEPIEIRPRPDDDNIIPERFIVIPLADVLPAQPVTDIVRLRTHPTISV